MNNPLSVDQQIHIRLLCVDVTTIDHKWNTPDTYSSYWRLYLSGSDGSAVGCNGLKHVLKRGEFWFVPAWIHFSCINESPVKHFYIHFDIVGLSGPAVRRVFNAPVRVAQNVDFDKCVAQITPKTPNHTSQLCRANAIVMQQFSALLDSLSTADTAYLSRSTVAQSRFSHLFRYIDDHLNMPLENELLADLCHQSTSHFIRSFSREMHQSPAKYVQERRVASAAQRLVFSDDSIDQIAAQTGFSNRFHFSRVFARYMTVPPATYRKTIRL
ncbi:MAG: helix-turn-helix transcriptional regulator [Sedimentisphaerales bacterium]|nr:helix-turn-helix transcriptional regulator [Sedimentisphaerales bacterium]